MSRALARLMVFSEESIWIDRRRIRCYSSDGKCPQERTGKEIIRMVICEVVIS